MKITIAAVAFAAVVLTGCGTGSRDKPGEALNSTTNNLETAFKGAEGQFAIMSCKATYLQEENCRYQHARLQVRRALGFQGNSGLLLERIYKPVSPAPLPETTTIALAADRWPGYKCEFSKGRSNCVSEAEGRSVRTILTPRGSRLALRVELPAENLVLELVLQREFN